MLSLNKIFLVGNLGKDAESRFTTANVTITNFTVATTQGFKKNGNWENETTWHNCTAFNLSDYTKNSLIKGMPVHVEGRIQKRQYTDKDGITRYSVDVIAERIIPLQNVEMTDKAPDPEQKDPADPDRDPFSTNDDLPF